MINIEINNQTIKAQAGERLIDVADRENISIPRFCYHKKLSVAANCRMCLVKVEGAPKLMPACTTYLTDGMRVSTLSEEVKAAQKSVMEFLLINHPLDCPVCDQGGECELQDVSLEFGHSNSRFTEEKRSFINPDIGPLISTELNRCIQCSRCVRFGQEIAGVMELGLVGRGMHTSINTFLSRSMNSELSGNVIDLCPVGALTAKPSRFVARSWEMKQRPFIAMIDSLGSNAFAHIHDGEVYRVTPNENEGLNEIWLSDIDRYAYQGNNLERIKDPMIKQNNVWQKVSWQEALEFASSRFSKCLPNIEVVINKNQSAEAHFMANSFANQLSLNQTQDNSINPVGLEKPSENQTLSSLSEFEQYVLIGTNLRYFEPLVNLAIRKGVQKGARVLAIETTICDFAFTVDDFESEKISQVKSPPHKFLSKLINALEKGKLKNIRSEGSNNKTLIIVGLEAKLDPNFAFLKAYLDELSANSKAPIQILYLDDGANSAVSQKFATKSGINSNPKTKGYLLIDIEPKEDLENSAESIKTLNKADFVISLSTHKNDQIKEVADVIFPLATHFESGGSHLNMMNQIQSCGAVIEPLANSKPAWKILTALEQFVSNTVDPSKTPNIQYYSLSELTQTVKEELNKNSSVPIKSTKTPNEKVKIADDEVVYCAKKAASKREATVRRAKALQNTNWAKQEKNIRINVSTAEKLGLSAGLVEINYHKKPFSEVHLVIDENVANNLVLIPFDKSPIGYGLKGCKITIKNLYDGDIEHLNKQTISGN